jgi:hypothetical protein
MMQLGLECSGPAWSGSRGMRESSAGSVGPLHYITLLCGTRSLMAMESRAIAGGLSADHQLPGVPKAKEVLLNKLIHNHSALIPQK